MKADLYHPSFYRVSFRQALKKMLSFPQSFDLVVYDKVGRAGVTRVALNDKWTVKFYRVKGVLGVFMSVSINDHSLLRRITLAQRIRLFFAMGLWGILDDLFGPAIPSERKLKNWS